MPRVSLVISTRDRPGQLAACLEALEPRFPADAETIVVSDGGSADPPPGSLIEPLRLRHIVVPHGGPAAARNRGLAAARGEIVAFTDDDCRPRAGWLTALSAGVGHSPPSAAGGTTVNGIPSNGYADAAQAVIDLVGRYERSRYGVERFFPANNLAFPATALRALGGFDQSFRTAEDRDLCRRWCEAGFTLRRVPEAVVEHHSALDLRRYLRQFFAYGRGAARFHSSRKGSMRESMAFHLHIPRSLPSTMSGRGLVRSAHLAGLLGLWEIANLAGFISEASGHGANGRAPLEVGLEGR